MPRTIAAVDMLNEKKIPYIVILTEPTTGSVKIEDNWGQGFYSAEQLSIVGSYPSLTLRNNSTDNKWLIHHDGNDLTFYAGADFDSTSWTKKVHVDSGNQGMGAQRFYDIDSTAYYVEPGSVSILNDLDLKNNGILKFYRAGGNALQRADARVENSTTARLHWYGSNDSGGNTAFQHAWYDGSNYINVTASNPGVITFAGSAASMYIGSDRVFDDGYHPNADKWTTARTLTLTGDVSGSVSWDGSGNAEISTTVANGSHTHSASDITSGTFSDLFAVTTRYNIGLIDGSASQTRDKIRVWSSGSYAIGMKSGFTYGHLNDYAMSFQMNNESDRGFWWGDDQQSDAQGAMSLTTAGRLTVATSISVGQGESITSAATHPLYVDGTAVFDTTSNTEPVCISRSGSVASEVLKIGVQDTAVQFNYIEDTSSEGTGNFGRYDFILGGNSSETSVTALKLEKTKTTSNAGAFTFGTPGNGTNTLGRWLSFEGNTDSSGEGSGRLFFSEHNSSTADMDDYGMSIGYRGGSTSVTTAGGNTWTGLSAIGNGEWGMWGHNNSLAGTLIMSGPRSGNYVNISQSGGIRAQVFYDLNNTNFKVDPGTGPNLVLSGGSYIRAYHPSWSNETTHDIFYGSWASSTGDYIYVKAPGNSTSDFGTMVMADNVFAVGRQNNATGAVNDSSTAPLDSTWAYIKSTGVYSSSNVYSGGTQGFVFGSSTSEGEYIQRNGSNIEFVAYGEIKFDITAQGVHVRTGGTYRAQISNTGVGRFANDVVAYYNFSDKRLKTNIKPTTNNLDKVLKLNPVEYNWKEGYRKDKKEIGLIAQEVEKIIPEVVRENQRLNDDTLYKQIDYEHLVSTLIGAVQEQQKQIDELKSIINGGS